ncbi:zinc finger CCCH domain-containing protein 14-like isoform X2 [Ptychodera flava]|uniref:zinc finger CCCH domain-containing protein 14-like isoform X2 n=1 Tax=Ptychodera flava TaxID=63121 RepID=UPI00396A41EF
MEIGAEISHKIRAAIKAKLVDLGAYVDDELPDYIMVMIANKKTQAQMADDLSLFLGNNTEKFTKWLHSVLQKLQSATLESSSAPTAPISEISDSSRRILSASTAAAGPNSSETLSSLPSIGSQSRQTVTSVSPRQAVERKSRQPLVENQAKQGTEDSYSRQSVIASQFGPVPAMDTQSRHTAAVAQTRHSAANAQSQLSHTSKTTSSRLQSTAHGSMQQAARMRLSANVRDASLGSPEPEEAIISLKPETHDLIDEELRSDVVERETMIPTRRAQVIQAAVMPSKAKTQTTSVVTTRTSAQSQGRTVSKVQPVARKRKAPGSVIGQVLSHDDNDDDEEGELKNRIGGVASVVRISERRSSLPPSKQASRALVLRAVSEATDSVSRVSVKPRVQRSQQPNRTLLLKAVQDAQDSLTQKPLSGKLVQVVRRVEPNRTAVPTTLPTRGIMGRKATIVPARQIIPAVVSPQQYVHTVLEDNAEAEEVADDVDGSQEVGEEQETELEEQRSDVQIEDVGEDEEEEGEEEGQEVEIIEDTKHVEYIVLEPEESTAMMTRMETPAVSRYPVRAEMKRAAEGKPTSRKSEIQRKGIRLGDQRIFQNVDVQDMEEEVVPTGDAEIRHEPTTPVVRHNVVPQQRTVQHSYIEKPRPVSPKFIVTLDGVDPPKPRHRQRSGQKRQHPALIINPAVNREVDSALDDEGVGDEIDDFEDDDEAEMDQEEAVLDDEDDVDLEREEDDAVEYMDEAFVRKRRPDVQPIIVHKVIQSDDEEMLSDTSPPKKQKMQERCKFWPTCKSGDQCQYHHPNVPCKAFPKCRYGDKCLYIHPNCKYDARCAKPDCPFTHASKRQGAPLPPPAPPPSPVIQPMGIRFPLSTPALPPHQVLCRFFPNNCKKMNCPYLHPKPCRYGVNCTRDDCRYSHPKIASGSALKWVRSNPSKPS